MPRLIHINGPPGIGKSTLAQMYVDDHPGVLNLDIDQLRGLIGGWRERFAETGELVRPIALSMASTHLGAGHDVVMPQYLGRLSEIERFQGVVHDSGAVLCEAVLMDTKERAIERFTHRGQAAELPWHRQVQEVVDRSGGVSLLADMYDRLTDVLRSRPASTVVPSEAGAIQQTYAALAAVLDEQPAPSPPRAVAVVVDGQRILVIKRRMNGRDYAVLPGGGVEPGESADRAAVRELYEETTLSSHVDGRLWHRHDDDREATYFLMTDLRITPELSGPEAEAHCPENSFVLTWATADDLDELGLQPVELRGLVAQLLR